MVVLRPSCCGYLASIECMSCNTANAHRYLASRQTGHRDEVAAYLAAVNLEGREKYEGGVFTPIDLHFHSQDPSKHQKRLSL